MFLTKEELTTKSTEQVVDKIIQDNPTKVTEIIAESIDQVKSYLHQYFDTTAIFNATGDARSKILLKHIKAIVMHELYNTRSKVPNENLEKAHAEAMRWLEKVAKGDIKPDLPLITDDNNVSPTFMKLGGKKSYQNHW